MASRSFNLGPLEMEVLGLITQPMSVSDIQAVLKIHKKKLAYTTVMTILTRLYEKGFVKRHKESRQYLYSPSKKGASVGMNLITKIQSTFFRNDKLNLILSLIENDLSKKELLELKKTVASRLRNLSDL